MTDSVATFIARPGHASDLVAVLAAAAPLLAAAPVWLGADEAADITFAAEPAQLRDFQQRLLTLAADRPVDIAVQPVVRRRKMLLVADMDSTMIGQECIDELADLVGLRAHVAAITERAMRGEIAFEPALRERVGLLAGLPVSVVDQVIAERIRLTPGAVTLVHTMRANGAYAALVSGGFTLFTERVAKAIGFNEDRANTLLIEDGKLSGKVAEPILGQDAKLATLVELRLDRGLDHADTLAIGDGANDLAMIREAGVGVAYHAKPKVAEAAAARVDHNDLTALLYIQGYKRSEFVTGGEPASI